MLQAYQGYFEKGRFYTAGRMIPIPERKQIILTILEEPAQDVAPSDNKRIDKRLAIAQSLKGIIPSNVDLEAARAERIAKRGLLEE